MESRKNRLLVPFTINMIRKEETIASTFKNDI